MKNLINLTSDQPLLTVTPLSPYQGLPTTQGNLSSVPNCQGQLILPPVSRLYLLSMSCISMHEHSTILDLFSLSVLSPSAFHTSHLFLLSPLHPLHPPTPLIFSSFSLFSFCSLECRNTCDHTQRRPPHSPPSALSGSLIYAHIPTPWPI